MSAQTNNTTVWGKVVELAKEHHRSVNAAHNALYNGGMQGTTTSQTTQSGPKVHPSLKYRKAPVVSIHDLPSQSTLSSAYSIDSEKKSSQGSQKSNASLNKAWQGIKKAAREHHESVNAAYHVYYNIGSPVASGPTAAAR